MEPETRKKRVKRRLRKNLLIILMISAVIVGFCCGIPLRIYNGKPYDNRTVMYVGFLGELFLRMINCLVLPIIITTLISAIGSLDTKLSGKLGGLAVFYYLCTSMIAVILGIVLAALIQPGLRTTNDAEVVFIQVRRITTVDTMLDLIRNIFPPNAIQSTMQQYETILVQPDDSNNTDIMSWPISHHYSDHSNILGIVFLSIVTGIALSILKTDNILFLVQDAVLISMKMISWVIWFSPIGIAFLLMSKLMETKSLLDFVGPLGIYTAIVAVGVLAHGFLVLPLILFCFTRKNPYRFIAGMGAALATSFGTGSSSATLPVTIKCVEENNKVDTRIARFVLPIGATINMNGTAFYEACACIYIAQVRRHSLNFADYCTIFITAIAASVGAAGIPQAGIVTMIMVLNSVSLNSNDIYLILPVDWLLDRIRTTVNVLGDAIGAGIIDFIKNKYFPNL